MHYISARYIIVSLMGILFYYFWPVNEIIADKTLDKHSRWGRARDVLHPDQWSVYVGTER